MEAFYDERWQMWRDLEDRQRTLYEDRDYWQEVNSEGDNDE